MTITLILVVCTVALGLVVGMFVKLPELPDSLKTSAATATLPVETTEFTDERQVNVTLDIRTPAPITSPRAGTITASSCTPGGSLESGHSVVSVDEQPVVLLHTSSPMWRDLDGGESGADVDALVEELTRLGYLSADASRFDWDAIEALHQFYSDRGIEDDFDGFKLDRVIWIAEQAVTPDDCPASIGMTVQPGTELAKLQRTIQTAVVTPMPDGLWAGDRTLNIGETQLPVDASGRSTASAADLSAEQSVITYLGTKDGKLAGTLTLSTPLEVVAVPSASVFGTNGHHCIADDERTYHVEVVASRLGSTLVQVEEAPKSVLVKPTEDRPCE